MTVARRDALMMLAGAGMAGSAIARTSSPPGLHALAMAKGMRFGSCVAWSEPGADRGSFENPAYAALLTRDCGLIVAEREMKWQALRPDADHFDFAHADAIVDGAEARRMAIRGHNLLWHQPRWMPHWLETYDFGSRPATEAERLLTTHITTVCGRYGQRIASYDVVNEAIDPADGMLHQTALSRAMGGAEATVDLAFRTARRAAPHAQLVYNDYMSWEPGNATHRAAVLRLLAGFRTRGVPVDALGIQSHITTQGLDMRASLRAMDGEWRSFLDAVTAMGYDLLITELDVRDNDVPVDVKVRDAAVADYTRAYLDRMFARPQLRDVLVWGMCDRYNWLTGLTPRPDGAPRRPSPYDRSFAAKPMRAAIAAAFNAAPRRPA